ncbi:hypothetical protein AMAG_03459 [Allomyces macrogynus ATCC 38327]|uniref:Uncharacterized protein n=1 Tax=Allomyces macrogynus (strain ATCC 38327) TaxID=578462 RepID=A0A0L0S9J9_ALLM3|nr:hypothetical protein AMAG_03459 [Allomyces macrogynus ATCC 38327]|eukprot:KNE59121.1 hypothetical protein AMAG_03459 [Allomyces macrogynus ATCC 38327]
MTFLIALIIAGSFVYDSARAGVVAAANVVAPPAKRRARANRYALFATRRLPIWMGPPPPQPVLEGGASGGFRITAETAEAALGQLASAAVSALTSGRGPQDPQLAQAQAAQAAAVSAAATQAAHVAVQTLQQVQSVSATISQQTGGAGVRALDSLPFPAPSLTRRVAAWAIDSMVVASLATMFKGTGLQSTVSAGLWLGRDIWLAPFGLPSPGRWLTRQVVLSPGIAHLVNNQFAPPTDPGVLCVDASTAAFLQQQQIAVVEQMSTAHLHDIDTYSLITHNSLRLMLSALGPLASLTWAGTTLFRYMTAPSGVWDGRTAWDRWMGVQVVDEEVLLRWATSGEISTAGNVSFQVPTLTTDMPKIAPLPTRMVHADRSMPPPATADRGMPSAPHDLTRSFLAGPVATEAAEPRPVRGVPVPPTRRDLSDFEDDDESGSDVDRDDMHSFGPAQFYTAAYSRASFVDNSTHSPASSSIPSSPRSRASSYPDPDDEEPVSPPHSALYYGTTTPPVDMSDADYELLSRSRLTGSTMGGH